MKEYVRKLHNHSKKRKTVNISIKSVINGRVFPLTVDGGDPKYAFKQVWQDLRTRAKIPEIDGEVLEFRDLRKAALTRFELAELTDSEQSMQMGHAFPGMKEVYLDKNARKIKLNRIRDKLDRLELGGRTFKELQDEINAEPFGKSIDTTFHGITMRTMPPQLRNLLLPLLQGADVAVKEFLNSMGLEPKGRQGE